ncbi:MAG: uroporphyrinogen decarboxylase family protein [Planctomycetes bacterium]|nr:uroporphyrinogen decarboxylase family protein [Planctomycetota bacterium]
MNACERFRNILAGEPVDRIPVQPIVMTFGARTGGVPYREYVTDHRKLVDCQIRTAREYDIDIVTLCSDPMREATDLGAPVKWFPDQPPTPDPRAARIRDKEDLSGLRIPDPRQGRMGDRVAGTALLREEVGGELPILGWVEGPIAEGADLRGLETMLMDLVEDPPFVRDLFSFIIDLELVFARAQVEAGADVIGIGDAAASLIDGALYEEHVVPFEKRLIEGIQALGVPARLHICGKIDQLLPGIASLGADVIDIDAPTDVGAVREAVGPDPVLLGNLDPVAFLLNGTPETVQAELARCHAKAGERFLIGAGCEIPPASPRKNVLAMAAYASRVGPRPA